MKRHQVVAHDAGSDPLLHRDVFPCSTEISRRRSPVPRICARCTAPPWTANPTPHCGASRRCRPCRRRNPPVRGAVPVWRRPGRSKRSKWEAPEGRKPALAGEFAKAFGIFWNVLDLIWKDRTSNDLRFSICFGFIEMRYIWPRHTCREMIMKFGLWDFLLVFFFDLHLHSLKQLWKWNPWNSSAFGRPCSFARGVGAAWLGFHD